MSKKLTSADMSQGDLSANDYREFAETFRAAATLQRHSVNIALNKPIQKCLPTKDEYNKFLSSLDYIQKKFFEYYKEYMECANTLQSNEKLRETAASARS